MLGPSSWRIDCVWVAMDRKTGGGRARAGASTGMARGRKTVTQPRAQAHEPMCSPLSSITGPYLLRRPAAPRGADDTPG